MPRIRSARPEEAELLSELAITSKALWGYDSAFLDACRTELTITPDRIADEFIDVAESGGAVVGFVALIVTGAEAELMDLFVDPAHVGAGWGTLLLDHARAVARRHGAAVIRIEADPNAEAWYISRGAVRIGEVPSGSIPGRTLPLLALQAVDDAER